MLRSQEQPTPGRENPSGGRKGEEEESSNSVYVVFITPSFCPNAPHPLSLTGPLCSLSDWSVQAAVQQKLSGLMVWKCQLDVCEMRREGHCSDTGCPKLLEEVMLWPGRHQQVAHFHNHGSPLRGGFIATSNGWFSFLCRSWVNVKRTFTVCII